MLTDWRYDAVCQTEQVDPRVFIMPAPWADGEADEQETRLHHEIARAYCKRCPVSAECLEYALVNFEREGVWGGTIPHERRKMWAARKVSV